MGVVYFFSDLEPRIKRTERRAVTNDHLGGNAARYAALLYHADDALGEALDELSARLRQEFHRLTDDEYQAARKWLKSHPHPEGAPGFLGGWDGKWRKWKPRHT